MARTGIFRAIAALLPIGIAWSLPVRADVFVLSTQGEVRGQLVNRDESPRKRYIINTTSGGQLVLNADQVVQVRPQSVAEMKYDRYRVDCPDTPEGHWIMSEWCRNNKLYQERKEHLRRVIELDPNHAEARRGLGYSQIDGRWVTQEQVMLENGYVRSKQAPGKWVLPQEEELLERREKVTRAQLEWHAKIKRWSTWLGTDKGAEAVAGIKAIDDPFAVNALAKHMETESRQDVRMLYLHALGHINVPAALNILVGVSLYDRDDEIRAAARDEVLAREYQPAVATYVQALKNKDNAVVNRAAAALGLLKDPMAISPLIDALVTTHTFVIQKGQPGQMSSTFSSGQGGGGGGFTFGGSSTQTVKRTFENRDVLQSLVELTGGTSFNFDVKAWKYWYVSQRKPKTLDARRDGAR